MKRISLVAGIALALGAVPALAQMQYQAPTPSQPREVEAPKSNAPATAAPKIDAVKVDMPKHTCQDAGAFPGRVGMQTEDRRNRFLKAIETYKTCMLNFVEERKAVIKANETAARAAIEEFNATMKRYADEQEKAKE